MERSGRDCDRFACGRWTGGTCELDERCMALTCDIFLESPTENIPPLDLDFGDRATPEAY